MSLEVIRFSIGDAFAGWEKLRAGYSVSGKYPFFIGDENELKSLESHLEFNGDNPQDIIEQAADFDVESWFRERESEEKENEWFDDDEEWSELVKTAPPQSNLVVLSQNGYGKPKEFVYAGLLEIPEPWMLPAYLRFGGWNECPEAHVHCALLKNWQEKFGAEIAAVTSDTIECVVKNPPATEEEATNLAWRQYWYCMDIVDQGTQNVANLGSVLLDSGFWFFWWD